MAPTGQWEARKNSILQLRSPERQFTGAKTHGTSWLASCARNSGFLLSLIVNYSQLIALIRVYNSCNKIVDQPIYRKGLKDDLVSLFPFQNRKLKKEETCRKPQGYLRAL